MLKPTRVETQFNGQPLILETGKMARQADGAVTVRYGDTMVLCTAVAAKEMREGQNFFPLTVNYQEKFYAGGKIPGSFFRRERGATERETLTCRLIDRPLRPMFPKGFLNETQIMPTVLSVDFVNDPDTLAMVAASAALTISDIPFNGPMAAVRVGRIQGEFVANPSLQQIEDSDLELVVAGTRDGILMVEGEADLVPEADMLEAVFFAHEAMQPLIDLQEQLQQQCGRPKRALPEVADNSDLADKVAQVATERMQQALSITTKQERHQALDEVSEAVIAELVDDAAEDGPSAGDVKEVLGDLEKKLVRSMIIKEGKRLDGRDVETVRPIQCEVGELPRSHGSALFTRGETQALVAASLGTASDEQRLDYVQGMYSKKFMLHYNFPPFCVGETSMRLFPGRREIGHGMLAERSVSKVLPEHKEFPYTIRVVSDILESNGSSSMASVCGASLALMDAGVPLKEPVAGIAMGLIKEGDDVAVLTDILGDEDHLGDMDFKVTGTQEGVAALQMDIKISGVTRDVMHQALEQARRGRLHIIKAMGLALTQPRPELSPYAPRMSTVQVKSDQVRTIIGPGGKTIRGIIEETGCSIDIEDDGTVRIASNDEAAAQQAIKMIRDLTQEVEEGRLYAGKVKKVLDFGAFVEIFPGTDGLVHISELAPERVQKVTDILNEGDEVLVQCIGVDKQGKIKLSRKEAIGKSLEDNDS